MKKKCLPIGAAVSAQDDGDRIIGGYMCPRYSQPWQAFVYGPLQCGGILVDRSWVLSAAHCYRPGLRVRLGEHNLAVREGPEQDRVVSGAILHPGYNRFTLDNDLMLLKLAQPITIGMTARPVTLPTACAPTGTACLISGWGTVTTPQDGQHLLGESLALPNGGGRSWGRTLGEGCPAPHCGGRGGPDSEPWFATCHGKRQDGGGDPKGRSCGVVVVGFAEGIGAPQIM
uniref:Peptidase S1 domain-containing protein n=1 Tax=Chelonoidis abingdonii TaxID=106734 RepID=A0A8C0JCP9_CHEAB